MELKDYQIKTPDQVKRCLELVAKERSGGQGLNKSGGRELFLFEGWCVKGN